MSDSFATPWAVACQAPLSVSLPRQEYWSGFPFPSPGESSRQKKNRRLLRCQVDSLPLSHQGSPNPVLSRLSISSLEETGPEPTGTAGQAGGQGPESIFRTAE